MAIDRVEQLQVYQQGFQGAMQVFEVSKGWPKAERYALTDQVRRSSRAVCSNLAEAWSKRRYQRHFVSKLTDAEAEASETRTWLHFADQCGYIDRATHDELCSEFDQVSGGLVKMMIDAPKWCGPSNLVREVSSTTLAQA